MKSIAYIPASNQATNASQMTVQSVRSPGATDIIVNTVTGAPAKFYGSMGAPHTFTDPVTGETITIISEATAVDFAGHLDSGKVVIDVIAPGYVDTRGSLVGDIVVIRPITEWANNIFNVLSESHNDDGTLKTTAYTYDPTVVDYVKSGGIWTATTGLAAAMTALVGYQAGYRGALAAVASRTFTASKDTYVDVLRNTTTQAFSLVYTEVANGVTAPALAANSFREAVVITNGSAITSVLQQGFDNSTTSGQVNFIYNTDPAAAPIFTYINSADAGGQFFYRSQGGIKEVWGVTNAWGSGGSRYINWPANFYKSTMITLTNIYGASGTAGVVTVPESPSLAGIRINLLAYTGAGTMQVSVYSRGS